MLGRFLRRTPDRSAPGHAGDDGSPSDQDPATPPRAPLRDDLVGGRHALAYLRHLARGNELPRHSLAEPDTDHPPVVLIHGFLGTRGSMIVLEERLRRDGITVFSFNLGLLNTRDIRESARLIQRKIDALLAQVRLPRLDIVGHSMGGLIGLYYVKHLGGQDKVRKLVMMGTPLRGTWSAALGIATVGLVSKSSWQIAPRSAFLDELHEGPLPPEVSYYSIAAERDWVCPPSSTVMPGVTCMSVPLGHSSLVVSGEVYRHVIGALRS